MTIRRMKASEIIDDAEVHFIFTSSVPEKPNPVHCHDFYEIMLIESGTAIHHINNKEQIFEEGMLLFIRPDDTHAFSSLHDQAIRWINVAFPARTFTDLTEYLGPAFDAHWLLNARQPPLIRLSMLEKQLYQKKFHAINLLPFEQKNRKKLELRLILTDIMAKFIHHEQPFLNHEIPLWLERLCVEMNKTENFTNGIRALRSSTNLSHEHICRMFRKHLHMSPIAYINELRLNYTANLLANSDEKIVAVCMDAGFESLSYFYTLFKQKFGLTPVKFRKQNRRSFN